MSRQLKFRAWDKTAKEMREVVGIDFQYQVIGYLFSEWYEDFASLDFSEIELMQFTGIKDKNGVEIYEGDVVWCRAGEHLKGIWEYEKQFIVEYGWSQSMWEMSLCDEIEVIGNIHENPELIKESKHE